jgi:hypothetical protein
VTGAGGRLNKADNFQVDKSGSLARNRTLEMRHATKVSRGHGRRHCCSLPGIGSLLKPLAWTSPLIVVKPPTKTHNILYGTQSLCKLSFEDIFAAQLRHLNRKICCRLISPPFDIIFEQNPRYRSYYRLIAR